MLKNTVSTTYRLGLLMMDSLRLAARVLKHVLARVWYAVVAWPTKKNILEKPHAGHATAMDSGSAGFQQPVGRALTRQIIIPTYRIK